MPVTCAALKKKSHPGPDLPLFLDVPQSPWKKLSSEGACGVTGAEPPMYSKGIMIKPQFNSSFGG